MATGSNRQHTCRYASNGVARRLLTGGHQSRAGRARRRGGEEGGSGDLTERRSALTERNGRRLLISSEGIMSSCSYDAGHPRLVRSEPSSVVERAWTVKDVCRFTGMGKTWVYEQVALNLPGGLPVKRVGSRLRFDPVEVRRWWSSGVVVAGSRPRTKREKHVEGVAS
ncbi:hypothetical protein DAT35_36495 [Vitiosangium sp. GDMCC 1.1324]|nr:hypothetical protein DAT35_36495 [Vitiosangium sp. GDMCC 1.1324]